MRKPYSSLTLAIGLLALGAQSALAQQKFFNLPDNPPMFLKIPGISGNAWYDDHYNEIEVVSIRQTYSATAPLSSRKPCSLEVVKPLDRSGPKLWVAAVTGQVFSQIEVALINNYNQNNPFTAYKITLTNARVVGITTNGENTFLEKLTFEGDSAVLGLAEQNAMGTVLPMLTSTVSCKPAT